MLLPKLITTLKEYDRKTLSSDLFAGITVGIVALPLAMAFAIASGVAPERGLFTAIIAGLLISLLGGSRVQIGGPTGAFVVIDAGIVAEFGYDGLVLCMLMAGLFLIALGLFRMGGLIKFIPFPVTTGFTSGIAVVIFSTQIKDLLGLPLENLPAEFIPKWIEYVRHLGLINPSAAGIGIGTIAIIILTRQFIPRIPAMLVGMVAATIAANLLGLDVETIARTVTNIKSGAKTPIAGIIHAISLALMLLFLAPLAKMIPLAALAGILVVVSYNMSEAKHFIGLLKDREAT